MPIARAFVAVVPPPPVLEAIDARLRVVSFGAWRPSRREQWHLTLEFLGRVDDDAAEIERLAAIASGLAPFPMRLGGSGAFPTERKAKVVWLGVAEGTRELEALVTLVRGPDAERFHPHVTVARSSRPRDAAAIVADLAAPLIGPSWMVDALELVASDTHPSGARYTTVARLALAGGQADA